MQTLHALLLVLAAAQSAPGGTPVAAANAAPAPEYLLTMTPPGLVPRTQERDGASETTWLPAGEPIQRAARAVTVVRIAGAAGPGAPLEFIRGLAMCLGPCPGQTIGPIDRTPFQGHPAARVRIDMPATAISGAPSRYYALAVSGDRALHVVTIVIRGAMSRADEDFAEGLLRSAVLCTQGSRAATCRSPNWDGSVTGTYLSPGGLSVLGTNGIAPHFVSRQVQAGASSWPAAGRGTGRFRSRSTIRSPMR